MKRLKLLEPLITGKLGMRFFSVIITILFFNTLLSAQNPIVAENALPGNPSSEWDIPQLAGDPSIQGFATDLSVNKGQMVHFKIKTDASAYTINIYRIGYYGGNGARKVGEGTITASLPQIQPEPIKDASLGFVDCGNWAVSAQWEVPANAVSGVYLAKLIRTDNGGASHIIFIVRDDASTSDLYFKTSDATWQAYNSYGGYNFYGGTTSFPSGRAVKISYNRPFITRGGGFGTDIYADFFFNSEYPMIRWLEQNGYNVTYYTSVDAARYGDLMKNHKICLSVGHDEYWSAEQRSAFEEARDAGVNLAFFSGNEVYWKTRWEADENGTPYKTLVCYKEGNSGENACSGKCDPLPNVWTGQWRSGCEYPSADGCNPENPLSGQISWHASNPGVAISVPSIYKDLRFWRNTGIASGQTNTLTNGVLGFEIDYEQNDYKSKYPAGRVTMSETTIAPGITHKLSLYRHLNGALVFGAGTIQWAWGLASVHDGITTSVADPNMQQATVNLFADMSVQPATLQTGLVAAIPVMDRQAPVTVFTTPNGAASALGKAMNIAGTATEDAGVVAGVEISTDGGASWQPAGGYTNSRVTGWNYSWMPTDTGKYTIVSRAFDDMGNLETRGDTIIITVNSSDFVNCPCNIFGPLDAPAQAGTQYSGGWPDTDPVELGVKFRSTVDGYITGIRFYKG
ncbi:MAG: N,N-dimethylformamidase beta subunit family domain-containing protein, partial [Ilyomonas sp.]